MNSSDLDIPANGAPYKPVACSLYDVLEAAAVRDSRLLLDLEDRSVEILVRDVFARGREEFLRALDCSSDTEFTVRLDAIRTITDPTTNKRYAPDHC